MQLNSYGKMPGRWSFLSSKSFLVMKLTAILLTVTCLQLSAKSFSQNINLSGRNLSLEKVLTTIGEQSGYFFFYKHNELKDAKPVTIRLNNVSVQQALEQSFKDQPFKYIIEDKTIIISKKNENENTAEKDIPLMDVRGKVTDDKGQPLPGATIRVKGSNQAAVSDVNGSFTLRNIDDNAVLVITYTGFVQQEIAVNRRNDISVSLKEDLQNLNEVVVVGYGTQKRVNLTGAVATVGSEVFEGRPAPSIQSAIQGALPGVTIQIGSGQPGRQNSNISIRGTTTLNSGSDPLILIDGVAWGGLDMLNPDDIESISVLKDASSAAIYGARAANGVLLVTTKKGKTGDRTSVNYSGYAGFQKPTRLPELVNGRDFMTLSNEARVNAGLVPLYLDEAFRTYDDGSSPNDYSNTDWIGAIYKDQAFQQSHLINVNGGSGKTGYYLSYGYFDQDGFIVGNSYGGARNNVRLRVNTELFNRLRLDGNISYITFDRNENASSGTAGVFRLAQRISPLLPVKWYNSVGSGWEESDHYSFGSVANPVDIAYNSGYNKFNSKTPSANLTASLDLFKGLTLSGQYAFTNAIYRTKEFTDAMLRYMPDGTEDAGNANRRNGISVSESDNLTQTLNTTLTYEKSVGDHNFKALAGYSQEWGFISSLSGSRKNILLEGVEELNLGTEDITNAGTEQHWALASYFGRINYNFKEKYLFEANIRYDGTSRFAKDKRWGTFPSFSAGWKVSDEPFMEFAKPVVNLFKLRGSYGELGNQNVGSDGNYYPYLTSITRITSAYPIGNKENVGFGQSSLGNTALIWETIQMTNLGLDLQLLNDRLVFTGDWFVKNNKNALLKPVYPSIIGFTSTTALPLVNMGKVRSKGWEVNLGWRDRAGDFRYSANANLSDVTNTVISLGKSAASLGTSLVREGDPLNAYFGYLTDGLAQPEDFGGFNTSTQRYTDPKFAMLTAYKAITQPGDIKYRDISGPDGVPDGIIDNNDRAIIGNPYPRYTYAFRGELGWKAFDLSFYLQGVGKVNGYVSEEAIHAFINDYSVPQKTHLDRWTPENPNASYPRLYYAQTHNSEFSDYWIQDASYLRLKNVQLGYTFPASVLKKASISQLRLYVSADNLFTKTNYFYSYDPEVRSTSGDAYPQVKTVVAGVSVTFK